MVESRPSVHWLALAAAGVTVLLWASAFVAIRAGAEHFRPGALALGRLVTGAVVLIAIWLVRGEGWPARAAWPGIAVSGMLWFGLYMVALNWAERQVDAGTAAIIVNVGPILIALLAGWLLQEGFPPRLLLGMVVAFAGTAIVGASMSGGGRASVVGVLLCLVAAATYAAGVVSQKPALRYASALQVTTFGCVIGMVACLPFAGQLVADVADAPLSGTLNVVYLGVFPTAVGFVAWTYALSHTTAGRMGATTYVVPAIVVLMSWAILGEAPGWLTLAGGVLCLVGVAVARSRRREHQPGRRAVPTEPAPGQRSSWEPRPERSGR